MSLSAKYQAFLASPSSGALADNASLNYITTLTTINAAPAIIKHLSTQDKLLKKQGQKVLSAIESANGLSLDVETTLEFVSGGGAYLPGLDDNFVADRIVTFPMIHIVHFDKDQKISQIRLYWDQGSLLKQIDVIGARARNWPIRDGKDQVRLVASSSASVAQPGAPTTSSRRSTASRGEDDVTITARPTSSRSSASNAMNDPHATLNLFAPREVNEENDSPSRPSAARVQSAKPPPREYSELFVGEGAASPSPANAATSPSKERIPVKLGGGKNYQANRLWDKEDPTATPLSVKTNSKKYDHFDFGDGGDEATPKGRDTSRPTTKSKHMSQWDFDDFNTPHQVKPKILGQAVRHFGWSDDEEVESPVRRPFVPKPRPDQDAHFEFKDDGTPEGAHQKEAIPKGRLHNKGLGLYKDHILHSTSDDEEDPAYQGENKHPLNDVTTAIKNENRQKDFGAHWEMTDESPGANKTTLGNGNGNPKHIPEDRQKVLKSMNANWGLYEQSPEQYKKENVDTSRGIKTSGNGMGGRKGTGRDWAIGDEEGDFATGDKKATRTQPAESKGFWDF